MVAFVSKQRVPVHGSEAPDTSSDYSTITPHETKKAEAFENLVDVDGNDDVGQVVDLYFQRPAPAHGSDYQHNLL